MRMQSIAIAATVLAALCPAKGQESAQEPHGIFVPEWSADVPGGQIRRIRLPVDCSRSVSLILRMDNTNLDPNGRFRPAVTVQLDRNAFNAPLDFNSESAWLQLLGQRDGSRSSFYFYKAGSGTTGERLLAGSADFHEDVPISLAWNEKNEVSAKVGTNEPVTITLDHAPATLAFSVSGAIATFRDVKAEFAPDRPPGTLCTELRIAPPGSTPSER
jgi:hypothetical protein